MVIVVMGVAGSGKSTVAALLGQRLRLPVVEGDAFHEPAALRQMSAGTPLTELDRAPWLDRINAELRRHPAGAVCACSALSRSARARLSAGIDDLRWVWLDGPPELVAQRLAERPGHPVGVALLPSQLAALEPPADALAIDIADTPKRIVQRITEWADVT
jgi:gluconokinase